jgi:hypothetical protein
MIKNCLRQPSKRPRQRVTWHKAAVTARPADVRCWGQTRRDAGIPRCRSFPRRYTPTGGISVVGPLLLGGLQPATMIRAGYQSLLALAGMPDTLRNCAGPSCIPAEAETFFQFSGSVSCQPSVHRHWLAFVFNRGDDPCEQLSLPASLLSGWPVSVCRGHRRCRSRALA